MKPPKFVTKMVDRINSKVSNPSSGSARSRKFVIKGIGAGEGSGSHGEGDHSQPEGGYTQLSAEEYARNFPNDDDDRSSDDEMGEEADEDVNMGDQQVTGDDDEEEDVASTFTVKRNRMGRFLPGPGEGSSLTTQRNRKKKGNVEWLVKVPEEGGPIIDDLVPSFGAHVAKYLWSNPDARGLLTPRTREKALVDLNNWGLPAASIQKINASGLQHLPGCMHHFLDMPLLTAFIERWQPDTNTFHMPFGEMTITLHDVAEILRLPVEGYACRIDADDLKFPILPTMEFLGMSEAELKAQWSHNKKASLYSGGGLLQEALQVRSQLIDTTDSHARGWLMVMLGSTLFADKTGDRVKASMFSLLRDVDHVGDYAWGAAALAYLYRQLGIATRAECKQICGCLTILQSWIYEHFRCFRPHELFDHTVVAGSPRSMLWVTPSTRKDVDRLKFIRRRLDMMEPSLVTWLPYCNYPGMTYPNSLYSGFIRFLDIVEPYQPDRCLRQYGFRQIIPRSISRPDYHYRPKESISYDVRYSDSADDSWYSAEDHRISPHLRSAPAIPCYAVVDGYMEWYRPRTHPFIIDPSEIPDDVYEDRTLTESEAFQRVVSAFGNVYFGHPDDQIANLKSFYDETLPVVLPFMIRDRSGGGSMPGGRGFIRGSTGRSGRRGTSRGGGRGGPSGVGSSRGGDYGGY